jgi:hypothetical protein
VIVSAPIAGDEQSEHLRDEVSPVRRWTENEMRAALGEPIHVGIEGAVAVYVYGDTPLPPKRLKIAITQFQRMRRSSSSASATPCSMPIMC